MRVGIIGAGLQGRRRAQALKKSGDELVIVAAAHIERAKPLADDMGGEVTDNWEKVVSRKDIEVVFFAPRLIFMSRCVLQL